MKISDERLRNTRAWAAVRIGQMSGAEVIVGAIDELFDLRTALREIASHVGDDSQLDINAKNMRDAAREALGSELETKP